MLYHIKVIQKAVDATKQAAEYYESVKELNAILSSIEIEIKPIKKGFRRRLADWIAGE